MSGTLSDDERTPPSPSGWNLLRWLFGARGAEESAEDLPHRIGRYRVLQLLGEGGMGRVHLAEDERLRRRVALKTQKRRDSASRRRFLREARAAARVSHPNVCPIFEVGDEGRRPFLAMELLCGETLAARLGRGPLLPAEALDLAEDLLAALGALHEAGVVHRDVKPSNLFLTPHGGKLVDFGLARAMPSEVARAIGTTADFTLPGLVIGTPGYMAPEQILGHEVDARADLFAAGALLYEALGGRRPFPGDSVVTVLSGTLYEEPTPLGGSRELAALDAPIRRALAKRPAERYASAREMVDALRAAAKAAAGAPGSPREAFVGREGELGWLEERIAAAVAGAGSVVFVTGERGVGKTALVGEFLRRLRKPETPITFVAGRCTEAPGPGAAFQPFLDALGRLLATDARDYASGLLRTYGPTIAQQMPAGLVPDPDGLLHRQAAGATKDRVLREAGDFMKAAGRSFPIVMLLEDMQWADPASVDLLHHLGCRLARQRTLIVGTFRQADVDAANPPMKRCAVDLLARGAARELAVGALSAADLEAYLAARFPGHRFPPGLAPALHARSEGLALFMRSLVDILVERGDIVRDGEKWSLARPLEELDLEPTKGILDLVRHQLDGLARPEREILEVASVAGREFLGPVVAHLVGREERQVEEDLRRLGRVRRLIAEASEETLPDGTPATRYRFAHGLYPAVLREDLVPSRRHELHRAIAARLRHHWGAEAPRLAAEIARHCEEGRDHEEAVAFRGHAGDNAARLFAYAEAEEHYDWAFRGIEKLPEEARPAAAISLHKRRGTVRLAQARFDDATADYAAMLEVARASGSPDAERTALAGLCDALFFAQRVEDMAARAQELLEAATRTGGRGAVAEAHARIGQVLVGQGRFDEAIPMLDRAIETARQGGPAVALKIALLYRGLVHYWQTEYLATETACIEALSLATALGDGFYALGARMFLGLARGNLGRLSEALDDFADAIAAAQRNDDRYWQSRLVTNQGWVHRELGALGRAREYDAEAIRLAPELVEWGPETEALLNLCVDDVREGRTDEALARLAEVRARAARNSWMRWMSDLRLAAATSEQWAVRGDPARADEEALGLAELARRLGSRGYLCTAERIRGQAALERGQVGPDAADRLQAALVELRRAPAPLEVWKSARTLGLLRRRLGDDEGAKAAFAEAARAVRTIAAGVRDDALRDGFLGLSDVREVLTAAGPSTPDPGRASPSAG
ncbi:MAG TPA: AAA family ATPase [Vicinamibacteria bacterium]